MKKWIAVISVLLLLVIGGYLYLRFHVLKAKDFKPEARKERTPVDLRPAIIAKLQQLVKDGSDGLYLLSIDTLEPDVIGSKLDAKNVSLRIDTAAMKDLHARKMLPDDIFRISFKSLHIDGIGIDDLLHKKKIDITGIYCSRPVIEVFHKKQPYNREKREEEKHKSLYEKLKAGMHKIAIGKIRLLQGSFTDYDVAKSYKPTKLNNVSVELDDILIDTTTQYATNRFLFAKKGLLVMKSYMLATPDSLYEFRVGSLVISGERHEVTASDIELRPRVSRAEFGRRVKVRDEMYQLRLPRVVLTGMDWWDAVNGERLIADRADLYNGDMHAFLDRSLPKDPKVKTTNFPHQLLMKIPFPVSVSSLFLHGQHIAYEEYNPDCGRNGTVSFDRMEVRMDDITNMPDRIRRHPVLTISGNGFFMKQVPMSATFGLNLAKVRTGAFTADVRMGAMDHTIVNTFSEPMAMLTAPSGHLEKGEAHITGDNSAASGSLKVYYSDLHINPLKEKDGEVKKKKVTSFLANVLLVKNANPGKNGELRQPDFSVVRDHHGNFFGLIWIAIKTGLLKTIGIPLKLGMKGN